MKLVVNTSSLRTPLTGIGYYAFHLLRELIDSSECEDIKGLSEAGRLDKMPLNDWLSELDATGNRSGVRTEPGSRVKPWLKQVAKKIPYARNARLKLMGQRFQRFSKQHQDYVYWEPNYLLMPYAGRSVTTIYDLSHIRFPQYHPQERVALFDRYLPASLERADKVIAISEFTRNEIATYFSTNKDNIAIVPPAVSDRFREFHSAEALSAVRKKYALPDRFILSVGTLEPRKNITGLVTAYSQLTHPLRAAFPLVLVGAKGWHTEASDKMLEPMIRAGSVIPLGYVPREDLPLLFAAADVFAYPSFYEGYGMPIAEAMASGTAVLTSDRASMPEVAAGCAELVNPDDIDSIATGLSRLLQDDDYRQSQSRRGTERSEYYTWGSSAATLKEALRGASVTV